ncbi:MAG TPA: hypothetical protein PKE39_04455 [Ignavibacteria bacterium]|nr:hypothetical protein [Ignavibacteria bacterium]HMQ98254.1 hypothetical protein [Ignavibacteria bacterium]
MADKKKESIKQLKPYIKKLYVEDCWDVPGIAAALNRNAKTIYNWVKAENWDQLREELNKKSAKTPEILLKALEEQIEKLSEAGGVDAISKVADSISKISKTIKSLYKDQDRLGSILFVIADIGKFIKEEARTGILPEDFFGNLRTLLDRYMIYALKTYSPGIKQ